MAKLKKRVNDRHFSLVRQYGIGLFILASVLVFSLFLIWEVSSQPFVTAKAQAVETAQTYAQLVETNTVDIYNGSQTYFSVQGVKQDGQAVWVLVPEEGEALYVYPSDSGISREEAELIAKENGAEQADRVLLGFEEGKPVWEVKAASAYYLIDFETGAFMKKEGI